MSDLYKAASQAPPIDAVPAGLEPGRLSDRVQSLRLPDRSSSPRGSRLPWLVALLALATAGLFAYRAYRPPTAAGAASAAAAPLPAVTQDVAGSDDVVLEAKGYIIPAHQIQVSPKVAGEIIWLDERFKEGERFEKNAKLAVLEPVENLDLELKRAQAFLANAQQRLSEAEKGWPLERQQAQARLDKAENDRDYRRREFERQQRAAQATSTRDRDEARSLYEQSVSMYEEARKAVELLSDNGPRKARIDALRAEVEQARAEQEKAERRVTWCTILAPIGGTILTKKAEKGNLVNPVAFNVSASLCEMANLRELEVDLSIQERDVANVFEGQQCQVMPEAYQKNEAFLKKYPKGYRGVVSRLMPIADRAKGAIPVRVVLDGTQIPKEEEGKFLRPDMGVIVSFKKARG